MYEMEVFVGNHCVIYPEVYELWLRGYLGKLKGEKKTMKQKRKRKKLTGVTSIN